MLKYLEQFSIADTACRSLTKLDQDTGNTGVSSLSEALVSNLREMRETGI